MSKLISSHNLAQLERIENGFKKNVLLAQLTVEKIDVFEDNSFILSLLEDSIRNMSVLVEDLFGLDMSVRDEVNFEPDLPA